MLLFLDMHSSNKSCIASRKLNDSRNQLFVLTLHTRKGLVLSLCAALKCLAVLVNRDVFIKRARSQTHVNSRADWGSAGDLFLQSCSTSSNIQLPFFDDYDEVDST